MKYLHDTYLLDPRDRSIVSYSERERRFSVNRSDLDKREIKVLRSGSSSFIWIRANKLNRVIFFQRTSEILSEDGSLIAEVFTPRFLDPVPAADQLAYDLSKGVELHILEK